MRASGLTANVRQSGDVFEVIVVDAISGEEVLSTHRPTQEDAEKFAFGLMNPSHDPSAIRLRAWMHVVVIRTRVEPWGPPGTKMR